MEATKRSIIVLTIVFLGAVCKFANSCHHDQIFHVQLFDAVCFGDGQSCSSGPCDIVRTVGEVNVFIPCPFSGPNLPTWKINNVYYEASSLPPQYIPAPNGLLIRKVEENMQKTTFQCFVSTRTGVLNSTTGTLEVEVLPNGKIENYNVLLMTYITIRLFSIYILTCRF